MPSGEIVTTGPRLVSSRHSPNTSIGPDTAKPHQPINRSGLSAGFLWIQSNAMEADTKTHKALRPISLTHVAGAISISIVREVSIGVPFKPAFPP